MVFKHKLSEATFEQGLQSVQEAASQSQALWGAKEEAKPTTVLQELSFLPPEMNVCFFGETLFSPNTPFSILDCWLGLSRVWNTANFSLHFSCETLAV